MEARTEAYIDSNSDRIMKKVTTFGSELLYHIGFNRGTTGYWFIFLIFVSVQ